MRVKISLRMADAMAPTSGGWASSALFCAFANAGAETVVIEKRQMMIISLVVKADSFRIHAAVSP